MAGARVALAARASCAWQVHFAWLALPAAASTALVAYSQGELAVRIRSQLSSELYGTLLAVEFYPLLAPPPPPSF